MCLRVSLNCGNPYSPDTDIHTNAPFRLNIYKMTQVAGLKKDTAQICSEQPEITDLLDFQKTLFWAIWG